MQTGVKWVDFLRRVPLFANLSHSHLVEIGDQCTVRRVEKGQALFHQGAEGFEVFVVMSGKLRVASISDQGQMVTLATRFSGEVIGEMAILEQMPRSATVVAERNSRLLVLSRDAFTRLVETNPQMALGLLQHLSGRVREVSQALLEIRAEPLRNRVLNYLASNTNEDGVAAFDVPQRVVAQEIGCTREALSRNLALLCEEGLIAKLGRGEFQILNSQ